MKHTVLYLLMLYMAKEREEMNIFSRHFYDGMIFYFTSWLYQINGYF